MVGYRDHYPCRRERIAAGARDRCGTFPDVSDTNSWAQSLGEAIHCHDACGRNIIWAFNYFDDLRDRFLKGDVSMRIGTFEINASGRTAFWRTTMESFDKSPIIGKGAGSAEGLIESVFGTIRHPHNDYLRFSRLRSHWHGPMEHRDAHRDGLPLTRMD